MANHSKNPAYGTANTVTWKVVLSDGTLASDEYGVLIDLTADEAEDAVEWLSERGTFATAVRDHF